MPNTECLKNMRCPDCGQEDEFIVDVQTRVRLFDEGTDEIAGDVVWNEDSRVECPGCGQTDCGWHFMDLSIEEEVVENE